MFETDHKNFNVAHVFCLLIRIPYKEIYEACALQTLTTRFKIWPNLNSLLLFKFELAVRKVYIDACDSVPLLTFFITDRQSILH